MLTLLEVEVFIMLKLANFEMTIWNIDQFVCQVLKSDCHITSRPAEKGGGVRGQLANCVYSVVSSL